MGDMPSVGVFAAHPSQVGPIALGAPLERVVVHALRRKRIMAVPLNLVPESPDHLAMAKIAAFAHIDVPACKLERRIRPHALYSLKRAFQIKERNDLDQSTDRDDDQNAEKEEERIRLQQIVSGEERTVTSRRRGGAAHDQSSLSRREDGLRH